MRNVNLTVASISGKNPKNAGKVVQRNGTWCLHQHVQTKWQRHDLQAWGVNTAVLDYLEKHGVESIYLYNAALDVTYSTHVGLLRAYGAPSDRHDWGQNINLPLEEWSVLPGRLNTPWVAENCAVMLHPKPLTPNNEPVEETSDDPVQVPLI